MLRLPAPLLLAAALAPSPPAPSSYVRETLEWRARREASLRAEDGWLAVAGLFWLDPGTHTVGSASDSAVVLPARAPARVGVLQREGTRFTFRAAPGGGATSGGRPVTEMILRSDSEEGGPDVIEVGDLRLSVIRRGGRYGVRLRDPQSPKRVGFPGLAWYPVDEALRVRARFEPHPARRTIAVANVLGMEIPMESPGVVRFSVAGREVTLEPVLESPGADELFFIFRDETAPRETYGGGRYLYTPLPRDGTVELDFNRAYTPPCAFTAYATCPLPPRQNRLPVRIEAGEKTPPGAH